MLATNLWHAVEKSGDCMITTEISSFKTVDQMFATNLQHAVKKSADNNALSGADILFIFHFL